MGCRVFFVRHGETVWNKESRFQGQTDVSLSNRGREQAKAIGALFLNEEVSAFYSSDLSRAKETAEIITNSHYKDVKTLPELREINFGIWEGLTYSEINKSYPDLYQTWRNNLLETRVPGGETLKEVLDRSYGKIRQLINEHENEQILIVSHGGIIRSIIVKILDISFNNFWKIRLDNGSVSIVDFWQEGREILINLNCTNHLNLKWPKW